MGRKYSKKSIKRMIKRILKRSKKRSRQRGGGGCWDKLAKCYSSQISCPLAPTEMMPWQQCSNICPTTQAKCDAKFPVTESKCRGLFPEVCKRS